jgi:predicted RNA-binding Zn-ribbon protein involved in translation (DUF1610 family)
MMMLECPNCGWTGIFDDFAGKDIDYYYNWDVGDEVMTIYCPICKNQIYDGGDEDEI